MCDFTALGQAFHSDTDAERERKTERGRDTTSRDSPSADLSAFYELLVLNPGPHIWGSMHPIWRAAWIPGPETAL